MSEINEYAQWFYLHDIPVFPLRNTPAAKRKEPAVKWRGYRAPGADVVGAFRNYGVPLGTINADRGCIGVVDTDSPESEAWVSSQPWANTTPLRVRTGKGWHRYYRLRMPVDKFFHRDGLTIEFRNEGQYVVGPGSLHPSGHVYAADDWSMVFTDIPFFPVASFTFNDGSTGRAATPAGVLNPTGKADSDFELPDRILSGERHDLLFRAVRSMKALGVDPAIAHEMVLEANVNLCEPPLHPSQLNATWFSRAWHNPDRQIVISKPPIKSPLGRKR